MTFVEMRDLLISHFNKMTEDCTHLFVVQCNKDEMWNTYLNSFPNGSNPIYRERTEHDCSCCRGFIKSIGDVVAIKNGVMSTIWDFTCNDPVYDTVLKAMSDFVRKHSVFDVYLSIQSKLGCHHNFEQMESVGAHRRDYFTSVKNLARGVCK